MPDILAILTHERDKLNRAIIALGGEIGGALGRGEREGKRIVTAATRAKIAASQKARWAKSKFTSEVVKPVKKFTMSPAARARIAKAQRARWARIKAAL